eukprot:scaffold75727_cov66-Phaeocystis_antarctica.AAC.3
MAACERGSSSSSVVCMAAGESKPSGLERQQQKFDRVASARVLDTPARARAAAEGRRSAARQEAAIQPAVALVVPPRQLELCMAERVRAPRGLVGRVKAGERAVRRVAPTEHREQSRAEVGQRLGASDQREVREGVPHAPLQNGAALVQCTRLPAVPHVAQLAVGYSAHEGGVLRVRHPLEDGERARARHGLPKRRSEDQCASLGAQSTRDAAEDTLAEQVLAQAECASVLLHHKPRPALLERAPDLA